MAGINFIILKINGIDVTDIPHEEAVQIFLKAPEPILVEVKRRLNETQQPTVTKPIVSPSHEVSTESLKHQSTDLKGTCKANDLPDSPNSMGSSSSGILQSALAGMSNEHSNIVEKNNDKKGNNSRIDPNCSDDANSCCHNKHYVSTAVQTDIFTPEYIFKNSSVDDQVTEDNIFEECLPPEIDIEEITLRKSVSSERLGLTVKYSSGNASGSDDTDTCTEVYIGDIMLDSVAGRDGRLRQGDQILQVNGRDVSNKEETESLIAENKNAVTLLVSRYVYADEDFNESGEFYEDEEQQIEYENYTIDQHCTTDDRSADNISEGQESMSPINVLSSPKNNTVTTNEKLQSQISSVLSTADPLHHANIKAHLESVNHEIALLNTRVENMMLHKKSQNDYSLGSKTLGSVYRVPLDCTTPISNDCQNNKINPAVSSDDGKMLRRFSCNRLVDSDTEHIYETIPESSESEPLYCSPYESSDQNIVEKWLEMQQDDTSQRLDKKRTYQIKLNKQQSATCQKSNSSGDDRENSSSAYNTGGSCNSNNQLTLELSSNDDPRDRDITRSTLTLCPPQKSESNNKQIYQMDVIEGCKQCQRQKKDKGNSKKSSSFLVPQQSLQVQQTVFSSQQQNNYKSRQAIMLNEQSPTSNCSVLRANEDVGKIRKGLMTNTSQIPTDTMYTNRANLHQTMLLQQKLFRQALLQQNQQVNSQVRAHFTAPNLSQYYFVSSQEVATIASKPPHNDVKMEWKVKRRQDGTRYIVRRPTRNRLLRDRAIRISEERNECTTEDDTISEIKTGRYWTKEERKKHIERARERRNRQQLIILNKSSNLSFASPVCNIGTVSNYTGMFPPPPPPSSSPNKSKINIQQSQQQQLQQQQQAFQMSSQSKVNSRQNSIRTTSNNDTNTIHKKILKKKKMGKEDTLDDSTKQITSGSGNAKLTGFLSVTTV